MRRTTTLIACLLVAATSCDDTPPKSQCLVNRSVEFAEGPLTILQDVKLLQVGASFVLAGLDGDTARWAPLSAEGELGAVSAFPVPARIAGPWFGVTGNQLVAVYVAPNPADAERTQVLAVAQGAGETATAPVVLFESEPMAKPEQLRVAVGSSKTGMRAAVAIGFADNPGAPIKQVLLGADAQMIGAASDLREVGKDWKCLQFYPSMRASLGLFQYDPTFTEDTVPVARLYDMADDGAISFIGKPQLSITPNSDCPVIGPAGMQNYLIGWNTPEGASVAEYSIEFKSVMTEFLGGTITFSGEVPKMVAMAPVDGSFAVAFAGTGGNRGPHVRLYDFQGTRQGDPLPMPLSQGNAGPVAAGTADKTIFMTYREGLGLKVGSGPRRFVRVACER